MDRPLEQGEIKRRVVTDLVVRQLAQVCLELGLAARLSFRPRCGPLLFDAFEGFQRQLGQE